MLELLVIIMQMYTMQNVFRSSIWFKNNNEIESIKALFVCIVLSSIFILIVVFTSILIKALFNFSHNSQIVEYVFYVGILFQGFITNKVIVLHNRSVQSIEAVDGFRSNTDEKYYQLYTVRSARVNRGNGELSARCGQG